MYFPGKKVDRYFHTKKRALYFAEKGLNVPLISRALAKEGLSYSAKSVYLLLQKLKSQQSVARRPGSVYIM